jgi:hypothetical protein
MSQLSSDGGEKSGCVAAIASSSLEEEAGSKLAAL